MRIGLIGSGNVATHLGKALVAAGHSVDQVYSRNLDSAEALATELHSTATDNLEDIRSDLALLILAVKDDVIAEVSEQLTGFNGIVIHTSGSTSIAVLTGFEHHGVLYPLQTFSKEKSVDFSNIPIGVEGNSPEVETTLTTLAQGLTASVFHADSLQRRQIHVAAVFACNFTNHFYAIAESLLKDSGLDFAIIRPLIAETAAKVQIHLPSAVQTGPAVRRDLQTLQAHTELLEDQPELQELYKTISQSIVNLKKGR